MAYRILEISIVTMMDVNATVEIFDPKSNKMVASIIEEAKNSTTIKFKIPEEDLSEFEVRVILVSEKYRSSWGCFGSAYDRCYVREVWFPLRQLFDIWEADLLSSYLSCEVGRSNSKSNLSSTIYKFITSKEFLKDINGNGNSKPTKKFKFSWIRSNKKSKKKQGEFKLSYKFSKIINPTPQDPTPQVIDSTTQVIYDDSD